MSLSFQNKIWTFGNHEPLSMYRRAGRFSTGGVAGGALWLEDWHHAYDGEACAELMASLGLNILHCRFYKGMGWDHERLDFPRVREFAGRCRARGITVLGYVQFATLYPEIMRREIPGLEEWAARNPDGSFQTYMGQYYRWLPCPRSPDFVAYLEKILAIMLDADVFDGALFDNVLGHPCYCRRCREAFRAHVAGLGFDFVDAGFVDLPPPPAAGEDDEIMDPLRREMLRFYLADYADVFRRLYAYVKTRKADFSVSGNWALNRREGYLAWGNDPTRLKDGFDFVLSQSGNEPTAVDGCVISQIPEFKMAKALGLPGVALNDADAASAPEPDARFVCGLFESLFHGGVPVDRAVMLPRRGGAANEKRVRVHRPILEAVKNIDRRFRYLIDSPSLEPVGLLYVTESIMLSRRAYEAFIRAETSLLRNHIPYRRLIADKNGIATPGWEDCPVLVLPDCRLMGDGLVAQVKGSGKRLVATGADCGDFDEDYRQRAASPFADVGMEKWPVAAHDILEAGWRWKIRHVVDAWAPRLAIGGVQFPGLASEAHAAVKTRNGRVEGLLFTSPVEVGAFGVEIIPEMRASSYRTLDLSGEGAVGTDGDGRLLLSGLDGMRIVFAE